MRRNKILPELLSPAGDMSALVAAVSAGADAVYVGGRRFGARAFAKNFDMDELSLAVKICHAAGVRLYVTVNTLIHGREMDDALEYIRGLYEIGIDAVIVCDMGLIRRIRQEIPALELHASTQMGIHNSFGADFAYSLGIERVVLARECSAKDILAITEKSKAEVEIFVHGALCVCHSGQCLFSSMVGGRSGNRGECAQPCRLPYGKGKYPLSLTDLSLARHIPKLISSGVASLKIEGRMKSCEYVYTVTRIFRKLLDEGRAATDSEMQELEKAFSRSGFTDGYYTGRLSCGMIGTRSDEDKLATREMKIEIPPIKRMKLTARAVLKKDKPSELLLVCKPYSRWGNYSASKELTAVVNGEIPSDAINSPLTEYSVALRLAKMGNTPFSLEPADIEIILDSGINLPPSAINYLRREAVNAIEKLLAKPVRELCSESYHSADLTGIDAFSEKLDPPIDYNGSRLAVFYEPRTLCRLAESKNTYISRFKYLFVPLYRYAEMTEKGLEYIKGSGAELGVMLPEIISESELGLVCETLLKAKKTGVMTTLVCNIGQIELCKELGFDLIGDTRLNIYNPDSKTMYTRAGVKEISLSPELTLPQARDVGGYAITLGRVPLMITERCFIKENFGCESCGKATLVDRKGAKFPIMRAFGHRNLILNSSLTYMGDKTDDLKRAATVGEYFIFSTEDSSAAEEMLELYFTGKPFLTATRRMGKRETK